MRPSPRVLALAAAGAAFAVGYPFAAERALQAWGARAVGAGLLTAGAVSLALLHRARDLPTGPRALRAAGLALPALALVTGQAVFLRLVPAAIQLGIAAVFALSLRGDGSLLQEAARRIHPYAPGFIAPYCRKVTAVFAGVFALQGLAVAALAADPPERWALVGGVAVWLPVMGACAVEWLVRKSWFRYYGTGPVDRLLRALLPPENTPQGRRSLEYIRRMRRELGMPPP